MEARMALDSIRTVDTETLMDTAMYHPKDECAYVEDWPVIFQIDGRWGSEGWEDLTATFKRARFGALNVTREMAVAMFGFEEVRKAEAAAEALFADSYNEEWA